MTSEDITVNRGRNKTITAKPYEVFGQIAGYVVPTNEAFTSANVPA